ncbi:MAG: pilus assembly protein [Acidothermaceae bacterium]
MKKTLMPDDGAVPDDGSGTADAGVADDATDGGNVVIEFIVMTALLLIPLTYLVLAVFRVQGSAYGITEAAREAGRAFVEADSSADASQQACAAATIAMRNQVATFDCATQLQISCISATGCAPMLNPGVTIRVEIDLSVGLPLLPTSVFGQPTTVGLHSVHDEVVDQFRGAR